MRKKILGILAIIIGVSVICAPMATAISCPSNCVESSILGHDYDASGNEVSSSYTGEKIRCSCDDGKGSSVLNILSLVVNIMTIGIGILGVVGITIVGIQYLTAGGNEEKTRKAKQRLFEIIIGLVAYVIIYALLNWLIPGFGMPGA